MVSGWISANHLPHLKPSKESLIAFVDRMSEKKQLQVTDPEPPRDGEGGSSAELAVPKSCLKKAKRGERVCGVMWKGKFATTTRQETRFSDGKPKFPERELVIFIECENTTPGRTLQDLLDNAEAEARAARQRDREKKIIIARAKKCARITLVNSFSFKCPVDFVKGVKRIVEQKLVALREKLLHGENVHDNILFVRAFLESFIKF
jgi:hypothetical protein